MRMLTMAGAAALAALLARDVRADEAAKERREAWDATKADAKQESREARTEAQQEAQETRDSMSQGAQETRDRTAGSTDEARATAQQRQARSAERKHPIFDGKENFEVKGKIQKVSASSITVAREELPAATLNVSKNTKIELDGEQASARQLRPGQEVKASFNLQGSKAEAVEIKAEKTQQQR